jgi:hypothetical protein
MNVRWPLGRDPALSGMHMAEPPRGIEIDTDGRLPPSGRPLSFSERMRVRFSVSAGRLWYGMVGDMRANCCFMHVPKCGGTSMIHALRRICPIQRGLGLIEVAPSRSAISLLAERRLDYFGFHEDGPCTADVFAFRRGLLFYFLASDVPLVAGHFLFDRDAFAHFRDRYRFISVLRDPVERMISHYGEERRGNYLDLPFHAYLETNLAWRHATTALRYFSGMAEVAPTQLDHALDLAKANLGCFSLVGFTEDLDRFRTRFADLFGRRLRIGHYRRTKSPKPDLDRATRRRLEHMCRGDLEFYQAAKELFD